MRHGIPKQEKQADVTNWVIAENIHTPTPSATSWKFSIAHLSGGSTGPARSAYMSFSCNLWHSWAPIVS